MKKQPLILLILVLVIITLGIAYFRYLSKKEKLNLPVQDQQSDTIRLKTFKSEVIDISLRLPQDYLIKEKFTHVEFGKGGNFIQLDRNAHAFKSLREYLDDVDEKDEVKFTQVIDDFEINGLPVIVRDEVRGGVKVRMYYIFTPDWVYVFSTDSQSLYSDLDKIVHSFSYTP